MSQDSHDQKVEKMYDSLSTHLEFLSRDSSGVYFKISPYGPIIIIDLYSL